MASVVQVVVGATGLIGIPMRFIGPLTVVPTIALIGLSVYSSVVTPAQHQWGATALQDFYWFINHTINTSLIVPTVGEPDTCNKLCYDSVCDVG